MLVIRLQRVGKKHQPSYRIVLQDSKWKPQGKALELLGFYNPISKEKQFQAERIKFWISKGAQPSPTLHNMFIDAGVITGEKVKAWKPKKSKEGAKPAASNAVNKKAKPAASNTSNVSSAVEPEEKKPASPELPRGEEEPKKESEPEQEAQSQPEEEPAAA
ncbi:MAG: 30S ribosomal protein S16 [Candidatus Omnitrophota bacterium]